MKLCVPLDSELRDLRVLRGEINRVFFAVNAGVSQYAKNPISFLRTLRSLR